MTTPSKKYENGHHPNSRPKSTAKHPWQKLNKSLPKFSQKGRSEGKLNKYLNNSI
jgi:hypothetical protein